MQIALLLGLILLNGLFAMSEIALVTARRARLQVAADDGDKRAALALKLSEDPTQFLSTIQIGMTAIGILNGIIGEAVLARPLALWMQTHGIDKEVSDFSSTALVVVAITYVTIVLGELVPKRFGQMTAERTAKLVARPITLLRSVTQPFVRLLSVSTDVILRLSGMRLNAESAVTEEEIEAVLAEGSVAGVIEKHEHTMVRNVFRLDERQIGSLMVPRADIVSLDVNDSREENLQRIVQTEHARFPVCRGGFTEVLGFVSAKQLLAQMLRGEQPSLTDHLEPAVFIPETLTGMELLESFRSSNTQIALVVDEYGEVEGLVTLHDVLEAITGEFSSADAEDSWAVQRDDGSWLLDGLIPIHELKDVLRMRSVPDEEKGQYHALSGMLMLLMGRVPKTSDSVDWENWHFEVVDMDGTRIDKVLASPIKVRDEIDATG